MTVLGFILTSIEASVDESKLGKEMKINSSPTIESIEKKEINVSNFKEVLSIKFAFETKYGEDVGKIVLKGELLYHTEDMDEVLKDWKEKKLKDKIGLEVLNTIMRRCLIQAIYLSEQLRLPPPIAFPIVKKAENKK
ncbi:MAG: hypothetical protein ACTSVB_06925 [Candidatus Heimdallarchaeaceae archaeon]